MPDTFSEVMERYRAMLLAHSGEERLKIGFSMNATARALIRASVLTKDPQASPAAVRHAPFPRLYGHEFNAEQRGGSWRGSAGTHDTAEGAGELGCPGESS